MSKVLSLSSGPGIHIKKTGRAQRLVTVVTGWEAEAGGSRELADQPA